MMPLPSEQIQTEKVKQLSTHFNIFRLLQSQLLPNQAQSSDASQAQLIQARSDSEQTQPDEIQTQPDTEQTQSDNKQFQSNNKQIQLKDQVQPSNISTSTTSISTTGIINTSNTNTSNTNTSNTNTSNTNTSNTNTSNHPQLNDKMATINKTTTHRVSNGTSSVSTADNTDQEIVKFVAHDGEHHTTVDESVFKVVTDEHIRTYQHEEITHALDKEIHEDHHYTVVQPIEVTENLPDKHTHNLVSVEHKTIDHRNKQAIRDQLASEAARFKNTTITHEATRSSYTGPEITSEHVHHHIHEHIQPVLHKEVLAHEYIHTTIPVHETHHVEAQHHGTTVLPSITLEEFRAKKGIWNGRKERRVSEYDGCPEMYEKKLHEERAKLGENSPAQAV